MLPKRIKLIVLIFQFLKFQEFKEVQSEIFSAIEDVTGLYKVEDAIITYLKNHVKNEKEKIKLLEKYISNVEEKHETASVDTSNYLMYPVNAYQITKRLTIDLEILSKLITDKDYMQKLESEISEKLNMSLPTNDDLLGSAMAIVRLQQTYNLSSRIMSSGYYKNVKRSVKLDAKECFILGSLSHKNNKFIYAIEWLLLAIERLKDGSISIEIKPHIFETLADSYNKTGNFIEALMWSQGTLQLQPYNEKANEIKNSILQKSKIEELTNIDTKKVDLTKSKSKILRYPDESELDEYFDIVDQFYVKLCRKDIQLTEVQKAPLRCRYVTNNIPFLKIAPFKVEEAYLDPYIITFHDVISDAEIEIVQRLSKPKLYRAGVHVDKDEELSRVYKGRVSKSAWLNDTDDKAIKAISDRVRDMTGLTTTFTENLQVVNYGIGGQYEPHFDFTVTYENSSFEKLNIGNRIATVLFYLTNVEEGGATVFPVIDVALWPAKGAASFWYNLYKSGEGDFRTMHAGCPVLIGNKWVANKWFHFKDQEFARPCALKPDHPNF